MGQAPIRAAGHVLRHAVGVLLLSWVRALRAGFIAGLAGVLLVELAAMLMTGRIPPDGTAQLVAGVFGFALAFGAAATVVADEILVGMRELVGMLLGEAEAGARVAATLAEREVGDASAGMLRVVGLGRLLGLRPGQEAAMSSNFPLPTIAAFATSAGVFAASRHEPARTNETLAELASAQRMPFEPRADAAPVPADQLPRLSWTDEIPAVRHEPAAPPVRAQAAPAADVEPATAGSDRNVNPSDADGFGGALPPADEPTGAMAPEVTAPTTSPEARGLAEPAQWHGHDAPADQSFTWHDPAVAAEPSDDEESYIQPIDVFGRPLPLAPARDAEPLTRPLPETTRPLPVDAPDASPRGSVWDHISQVLAGRPVAPLPDETAAADTGEGEAAPPAL